MAISLAKFVADTNNQFIRPRVYCEDGYSISIQANDCAYCVPRANGRAYYESFELGYPSDTDDLIDRYSEDPTNLLGTVYPYIDWIIVEKLLDKHGGIVRFEDDA